MYELLPNKISHDVVETLETLLAGAKTGEITGVAYAATLKRMRYITDVAGVCYKNPTFARGAIATLSDEIGGLIHRRDPDVTR
jgi:hypothetical protein